MYLYISACMNFSGEGIEVNQGRACSGGRRVMGRREGGAHGRREFFEIFLKINAEFTIFDKFNGIFWHFSKFLKILSNFSRKFWLNLKNFRNMHL